jgi:hemolysin activation/secretion protein
MTFVTTAARTSVSAIGLGAALLALGLPISHAAAQTTGQTRGELETPPTEDRRTNSIRFETRAGGGQRESCPFEEGGPSVTLNRVVFKDARPGVELASELQETLGRVAQPSGEYPLTVVCDLRDAANDALRRAGWIATVQVPPQDVSGTLELAVVSARLTEIRITGDTGPYRERLQDMLSPLIGREPLNEREAERILLNANGIPGLEARLALAPAGSGEGAVIGNLSTNYERFRAYANVRNYNAQTIGRETVFGRVEYYGLTGWNDITHVAAQSTADFNEQIIAEIGHEFGVGRDNIRIGTSLVFAAARPDIQNLDLATDTLLANLNLSYPAIRTPLTALDFSLGFDVIEQETSVGPVPLSKDSIRTLYARAELEGQVRRLDRSLALAYRAAVELRQGLEILGSTNFGPTLTAQTDGVTASRPFGAADATVVIGEAEATWFPLRFIDLRGVFEIQWTNQPLLNFDEFAIGNLSIGRGYDPGANSGDRAIGGIVELGATLLDQAQHRLKLFGFYDIVRLENLDRGTPDPDRTLRSFGGGLRYSFGQGLDAELIYASPQDRPLFFDTEVPPDRVLFSITTKFPTLFR